MQGFNNGGNTVTNDPIYNEYLAAGYTVTSRSRLCPTTFAFQRVVDPTSQNTRLEAGMRNDGIAFIVPQGYPGDRSFGFNHVLFGLPEFAPNFQQGLSTNDAANVVTQAVNLAIVQVQQDIQINGALTGTPVLSDNFWGRVNTNISNSLGINPITNGVLKTYITLKSGGTLYYNPNTQITQTIVYRIPVTGC